jgi:hypothetical protein
MGSVVIVQTTSLGVGVDGAERSRSELEREGVRSFCDSYRELLDCIETKIQSSLTVSDAAAADPLGSRVIMDCGARPAGRQSRRPS